MKRTEKNRLLQRIKLRPPQHWWKAKRVRTSVATQENAPVYMNHLRTNTSRTPMRHREMMVAAVQLQVIFVLQSTLWQSDAFTTVQCPRKMEVTMQDGGKTVEESADATGARFYKFGERVSMEENQHIEFKAHKLMTIEELPPACKD
ncbi:hypothetical protein HPB51_003544 [Rhipicephalus microplus]|uniref:Uncharacterized protein n=1 Tax=Rhipicephalus microplus TaxID=6941 RepID=A0A9J6D993_RHIMP|nr:hypothetical protein HPB51_003544 [Rhipicephalus microplus]